MKDTFGDRMKLYENQEAGRRCLPLLPVLARIDGRSFSGFTAGLERPFDLRLSRLMIDTTDWLVQETVARMGYTQSDEITLAWYAPYEPGRTQSSIFFDGRLQKMTSVLASMTAAYFNSRVGAVLGEEYARKLPHFDCRVWTVPTPQEGANVFLWREHDATKNSISMAARHYFSHNQLMNKNGPEMQEMLWQRGVNWNDYPRHFRRGTYIQRRTILRPITEEEMGRSAVPVSPETVVEQSERRQLGSMPPFGKVANRPEVVFFGADPIVQTEE